MIVANTTFRIAPWADALFAMDRAWWEEHFAEVSADFVGQRFTCNPLPARYGVTKLSKPAYNAHGNSGAGCVSLAALGGAGRVLMLGFDCQHTGGMSHWHGNHPRSLGNAGQVDRWPAKFRELQRSIGNVEVINASRVTALDVFPRMTLEDALNLSP